MPVNISSVSKSPFPFVYSLLFQQPYIWFPVSAAFSLYARGQNYGFGIEILEFMGREETIFWPLAYEFCACLFPTFTVCVISGFSREVAEKCALLSYYAATSGNFLEITSNGCLITQKKTVFTCIL